MGFGWSRKVPVEGANDGSASYRCKNGRMGTKPIGRGRISRQRYSVNIRSWELEHLEI